jgi:hypothetical protein
MEFQVQYDVESKEDRGDKGNHLLSGILSSHVIDAVVQSCTEFLTTEKASRLKQLWLENLSQGKGFPKFSTQDSSTSSSASHGNSHDEDYDATNAVPLRAPSSRLTRPIPKVKYPFSCGCKPSKKIAVEPVRPDRMVPAPMAVSSQGYEFVSKYTIKSDRDEVNYCYKLLEFLALYVVLLRGCRMGHPELPQHQL